eukprot:CAMPEP_0174258670 /NCGR_PEP_ID=MMETSP0439-20130205/7624_1 /TAXON_ID=0 /ORGANISM="Stereomyxa ramosa, Strain Chinc5" /LENGTH=166 /DNA_ID=CAMNT_0015342263 /DNA_START=475 /DNA_END=975 /DNA_ORIENTATION=-
MTGIENLVFTVSDAEQTDFWGEVGPYLLTSLGAAFAVLFSAFGAARGTAKGAQYMMSLPEGSSRYKFFIPIIMSGVLAIYGLIVAVVISGTFDEDLTLAMASAKLGAGLSVGLSCLASGYAIGGCVPKCYGKEYPHVVPMVLSMIFSESIGLYGLIVALIFAGFRF